MRIENFEIAPNGRYSRSNKTVKNGHARVEKIEPTNNIFIDRDPPNPEIIPKQTTKERISVYA